MLDAVLIFLFLLSGALFVYHHLVYPVLLKRLAARRRESGRDANRRPDALPDDRLPGVALLIPAYNEAAMIGLKARNVAAIDYPRDRLRIRFALDGCTDDTEAVLREALAQLPRDAPQIEVVAHAANRGKILLLNEHIGMSREQVVALNDATAMIDPDALRHAVAHFQDPRVGVVGATYRLSEAGSEGERVYWNYQTQIKTDESSIASVIGTHGAFYLMRRDLWEPLPADTINDDFVMPMRIVANGYRAAYDREIVAIEAEQTTSDQDFRRRIRMGAGNMQQLLRLLPLASPKLGWVALLFASGKGLRPLIPFFVLLALLATLILALRGWGLFQLALAGELALLALAAYVISREDVDWPKPLAWLAYLVKGHTASFFGALRLIGGGGIRWSARL